MNSLVQPVPGNEGAFKFVDMPTFRKLHDWEWYQVFDLFGGALPPQPPTKKEAKAARWAAWEAEQAAKHIGASSSK